jgi:pimeloyl-ACP methyl ester carboxylesterase
MKHLNISLLLLLSLLVVTPPSHHAEAGPVDFIFGAGSFGRKAGTTGDCRNILQRVLDNRKFHKDTTWKDRIVVEREPNFLDDLEYMEESKYVSSTLGLVDTKFVKEFDTRFYYTATAKPKADGTIPMVDPDAKALVVYFHGSGTMKASGVGFAGKMNALSKLGYSSLSFDLPFHAMGSMNPALSKTKEFAEYIESIIQKYKVPGQKVILVGHSFGPDLIAEYITRYPKSVDSAVLVSPGSFDKATEKWYNDKTSKMDFGDTESNDMGGRWAGMVTNERTWNKPNTPGRVDPTKANPDLDVYVISGDKEEYVPGELGKDGKPTDKPRDYDVKGAFTPIFSKVDVTIEPGVGHYIFNHKDSQGQDVVLRSVLKANGESMLNEKEIRKAAALRMQNRPGYETMAIRYAKEPFFKKWLDNQAKMQNTDALSLITKLASSDDKKGSQAMLTTFGFVEKNRLNALYSNIKNTSKWAPEFYNENKVAIDALEGKGDQSVILAKYNTFLKGLSPEQLKAHARTSPEVYTVIEKAERPRPAEGQGFNKKEQQNRKPSEAHAQ